MNAEMFTMRVPDEIADEEILDRRLLEVFYGKSAGQDAFDEEVIQLILGQGCVPQASTPGGIDWVRKRLRLMTQDEREEVRRRIKLRLTGVLHRL